MPPKIDLNLCNGCGRCIFDCGVYVLELDADTEKARLIASAQAEAERITKDAEGVAFDEVKRKTSQSQKIRQEAEDEA